MTKAQKPIKIKTENIYKKLIVNVSSIMIVYK